MVYMILSVCIIMIVQCMFSAPSIRRASPWASAAVVRTCLVGYSTVVCLLVLEGCFVMMQS